MKIAILGGGSIGTRHAKNLITLGVALADITVYDEIESPRCKEEIQGIRVLNAMTTDVAAWNDFEAGVICTPSDAHAHPVRSAIRSRVPFLIEKPAVVSVDELGATEWETDVPHVVGYNWRFHPRLARAHVLAQIADAIDFECRTDMRVWPGQHYGPTWLECSHEIDLAIHWCGPVKRVGLTTGSPDQLLLEHDSGQTSLIVLRLDWLEREQWGRSIAFRCPFATCAGHDVTLELPAVGEDLDESYLAEMRHFLAVARGHVRSLITLLQARRVVDICAQASAAMAA